MNDPVHKYITGTTAVKIAASIEEAVQGGRILAGERLPTVRDLARRLRISPATVNSAYQTLQLRGLAVSEGRRGTRISDWPGQTRVRRAVPSVPAEARNLYDGNPDPALLPNFGSALARIDTSHLLYGGPPHDARLLELIARDLAKCGVAKGALCVVCGAMDGLERVLIEHLRCGDRVGLEDPGFGNIHDLVISRGLNVIPVAIDESGIVPEALERAIAEGILALVVTPRAQNPTGAAYTEERARALRRVLRKAPDLLTIEDDHAAMINEVPLHTLHTARRRRWVYLRSLSKALNPDLRVALMTGDGTTMSRVQDHLVVGERWVSHILQRIACALLGDTDVRSGLKEAGRTYSLRRGALVDRLVDAGISATARSGYNVWIPVAEETPTVQALLARGWAVSAGERFRIQAPPAIRVTAATLLPDEAARFAADLADILTAGPCAGAA